MRNKGKIPRKKAVKGYTLDRRKDRASAAAGAHAAGAAVARAAGAVVARTADVDQDQGDDDHPYDLVIKKVAKTVHFSSSFKENRGPEGVSDDCAPDLSPAPLLYHCMQGRKN